MRHLFLFIFTFISFSFLSCISPRELKKYAHKAKEPGKAFVVYNNWDTLKGNTLKKKRKSWTLDGKPLDVEKISAYQNKEGYAENGRIRIIKGKLSLFGHMRDNSYPSTRYSSVTGTYRTQTVGATITTFYLKHEEGQQVDMSYNALKRYIQDCPAALKKFETVFAGTSIKRHPDAAVNHYWKFIPVINIYNANCP